MVSIQKRAIGGAALRVRAHLAGLLPVRLSERKLSHVYKSFWGFCENQGVFKAIVRGSRALKIKALGRLLELLNNSAGPWGSGNVRGCSLPSAKRTRRGDPHIT